jgi:hypothetical protein
LILQIRGSVFVWVSFHSRKCGCVLQEERNSSNFSIYCLKQASEEPEGLIRYEDVKGDAVTNFRGLSAWLHLARKCDRQPYNCLSTSHVRRNLYAERIVRELVVGSPAKQVLRGRIRWLPSPPSPPCPNRQSASIPDFDIGRHIRAFRPWTRCLRPRIPFLRLAFGG